MPARICKSNRIVVDIRVAVEFLGIRGIWNNPVGGDETPELRIIIAGVVVHERRLKVFFLAREGIVDGIGTNPQLCFTVRQVFHEEGLKALLIRHKVSGAEMILVEEPEVRNTARGKLFFRDSCFAEENRFPCQRAV